jgi:hypothetical protein
MGAWDGTPYSLPFTPYAFQWRRVDLKGVFLYARAHDGKYR